jgi:hypothetical protein
VLIHGYRVKSSSGCPSYRALTELQSYLWTKNGLVLENMLNYTTTVKHRHRIVSHVQIDFCKGCGYIAVHRWDVASPLDTNGLVQIGNESSAQAYAPYSPLIQTASLITMAARALPSCCLLFGSKPEK